LKKVLLKIKGIKKMKIGLPNALINQYYISFWKPFFETLGLEVIVSPETTKSIIDKGIRNTVAEICAPIKIYMGHVIELLDTGVDFVYIPRFVSICDDDAFCPKFLALPDMLNCAIPELKDKMITHHIVSDNDDIATLQNYFDIGKLFTNDKKLIYQAIENGRQKWQEYRNLCVRHKCNSKIANDAVLKGINIEKNSSQIKIGLIGYVYNIYDNFISMNIMKKLADAGVEIITFEMLEDIQIEKQLQRFPKKLFWTFSNKIIAAGYHFLEDDNIDGVIHATAFGCGPDAFIGKYLELDSAEYEKPFMTIRVDEHTGENHLQTRLEAFVDMLIKSKQEEMKNDDIILPYKEEMESAA